MLFGEGLIRLAQGREGDLVGFTVGTFEDELVTVERDEVGLDRFTCPVRPGPCRGAGQRGGEEEADETEANDFPSHGVGWVEGGST